MPCRVLAQKFSNFGSPYKSHRPFLFHFVSNLREKKKTSNPPPLPLPLPSRFTRHARTRFIRVPFCSSRECYEEKKRGQRGGVFRGGRKIDIATRTLGYSVNDDKRLPRTITADNGKNHCWKRRGEVWNTSPGWRGQE